MKKKKKKIEGGFKETLNSDIRQGTSVRKKKTISSKSEKRINGKAMKLKLES